ncbi:MAG TPA: hypothetical protein PLC52_04055 [Anaerolineales bacterium]|nr:hypothetical protein [Anaerolineales bacterium]HRQ92023.1 hypothetical protein [Anaerolineales bacterium]
MHSLKGSIAKPIALIFAIAAIAIVCMVYPFLTGGYDRLAVPLSTMVQVFGVVGLALVPGGLLWLAKPKFGFALSVWSSAVATCIALVLALFATLSVGNAFGILTLAAWAYTLIQLIPELKRLKHAENSGFRPVPLYLVCLPVLVLAAQLVLAGPMTQASRDRAIANASLFIEDIEQYYASHGRYPLSLQAQNRDYYPNIVGVERYIYVPQGDSYNLSFEQPRFLLDRFGTREWVVYNPRDEHRVFSHTAWLLAPPEVVEPSQGWYAVHDSAQPHWRYFWFD